MRQVNITHLLAGLPAELLLATFAQMHERTRRLAGQHGVQVRLVGEDRTGMPIEMISIGDGPLSVLVVGAPHPNEPVGCVAIEWLAERLAADARLREQSGCRWHFIKAIEPYALQQNEAWFDRRDVATYLQHFYRPPGDAQAEYAFPPAGAGASTPENEAYRQALKLAQPDLLASLHNSEGSGAFYFLTRGDVALANRLSAQAASHGLPLNLYGEQGPDVSDTPLAPGVFLLRSPGEVPEERDAPAGRSVTDWLADQSGTSPAFLVPEVPNFLDRTPGLRHPSMAACLESLAALDWRGTMDALLAEHLASLSPAATPLEQLYLRGITDGAKHSTMALAALMALPEPDDNLARVQAHVRADLLLALRPVAMARRLAAMRAAREDLSELAAPARACEAACARALATALASPVLRDAFQPVPLRAAVAAQLDAVLATAQALAAA